MNKNLNFIALFAASSGVTSLGFATLSTNPIKFFVNGITTADMTLDASENLVIGTTTSAARLHSRGAGTTTDLGLLVEDSGGTDRFEVESNGEVLFSDQGGTAGQILTSGGSNAPPVWTSDLFATSITYTISTQATDVIRSSTNTTHQTLKYLWIDAAGTSKSQDTNILNGYTDATATVIFTVVGVKSDGSESTGAQYAATFNKDGGTTVVEVGSETQIYHHETDAATTVTISVASNLIRVVVDSGDADSYRWTVFADVTVTEL